MKQPVDIDLSDEAAARKSTRALAAIGEDMTQPYVQRACDWLLSRQQENGGWGESCASYDNNTYTGTASTPSQTAWALLALHAAGLAQHVAYEQGVRFLLERQQLDGTWDEPQFTGTGFPKVFYLRYHLYRHYFPRLALGRTQTALTPAASISGPVQMNATFEEIVAAHRRSNET